MTSDNLLILQHLLIALAAGGLIGFERSYHGRPAGFRTHALVCVASSALMLVTVYQGEWFPGVLSEVVRIDPTRMAQGIMTGIGFLGAGVIFKEGLTVRGLTTAASIWITAAIGILAGVGFYFPLIVTTLITLGTLSLFRWIEVMVPGEFYAHLQVRFPPDAAMPEDEFRKFIGDNGFSIANLSYYYTSGSNFFEYQMVIRSRVAKNARQLQEALRATKTVLEFRMSPTGD
jgi:putative Mg2+ transporter-C (MgtC) family protein